MRSGSKAGVPPGDAKRRTRPHLEAQLDVLHRRGAKRRTPATADRGCDVLRAPPVPEHPSMPAVDVSERATTATRFRRLVPELLPQLRQLPTHRRELGAQLGKLGLQPVDAPV